MSAGVVRGARWVPLALLLGAGVARGQDVTSSLTYRIDVRQALGRVDRLGADFDFRYDREGAPQSPTGHHFSWRAAVSGFQTFDRKVRDVDNMAADVALLGRYYGGAGPLPAELQVRMLDLTGRDKAGGGPGLTAAEGAELNRLVQRALGNRKYVEYDLHYRLETTEDVTTKLHVFGGRLSAELPAIHRFLDVIPQQTRRGDSQFRVKPVRAYLSVDYVSGIDKTALGADTSAKHVWRAELQAAWSTHLFNEFVLRAVWSGEYLIDAPAPVKAANREFNAFTQVWMTYPLSGKTGVLIKYVSGRLPPNYELATGGSMGLSISLQ